jgi:hypothetical protein
MLQLGTPVVLMDRQIGHLDGSVGGRYSHVTREMVTRLTAGLDGVWRSALETRRAMAAGSPVAVLDRLLREVR